MVLLLLITDGPTDKSSGLLRLITDGPTDKSSGLRINPADSGLRTTDKNPPDCGLRTPDYG